MDNCISCEHFAWWDGDFCCCENMKILQLSPKGEFTPEILKNIKNSEDCSDYKESENKIRSIYEEAFKKFLDKYEHEG